MAAVRLQPVKTDSPRDTLRSFLDAMDRHVAARLLRQTLKLVALVLCLLLGAQNMGMDVASLIAGLGIGGLASPSRPRILSPTSSAR